ncbi:DUF2177 family protein [Siculibacillus lacustris]|uniref:DUF2177 family protein n=1 Tax=Siculibacillus lacustris TaxID=1549641 RepID=A0A4Q9VWK0_9HYPH|nr:DUF2177 family protein [Siculibacillus lacustris]TBW40705.1 DUF2177 family protein [Siculibacillus lacustris]
MKTLLIAYVATLAAFLAIDFVWLSRMGEVLYRPILGDLLRPDFLPLPALIFYAIFVGGLVFFAVRPSLAVGDWTTAALNGAVLGFVAYATYDLTNQATLRHWSTTLTLIDLAWGTVLSGLAATAGHFATAAAARFG